jgi:hypothetical protein
MKKILIATVAIASILGAASAASAETASQAIVVGATVGNQCGLGNQSGGGVSNPSTPIALGEIADSDGFLDTSVGATLNFGNVWCNSAATVSMEVTALTTSSPNTDPSSFLSSVDMVVDNSDGGGWIGQYIVGGPSSIASNGTTNGFASGSTPGAFETGSGQYAEANLHLAYPAGHPGNDRPLAGTWSGTVTFTASNN